MPQAVVPVLIAAILLLRPSSVSAQVERTITSPPRATVVGADGVPRPALRVPENVNLAERRRKIEQVLNTEGSGLAARDVPLERLVAIIDSLSRSAATRRVASNAAKSAAVPGTAAAASLNATLVDPLTAGIVVGGLVGLSGILNDMLNQVDAMITSQLFALRTHIDASILDLNVVFRDRMDQAFFELEEAEKRLLTQADVMLNETTAALRLLEEQGYEHALAMLCEATAIAANTQLVSIDLGFFERPKPPDIVCLQSPFVRDPGSNHERLLQFRGVNLLPNGEYPQARLSVASLARQPELPTAGGQSMAQVALPGGINGDYDDTRPRGDYVGAVTFTWPRARFERRWMFMLRPFVVRTVDVAITPTVEVPVYSVKADRCAVHAEGGSFNSNVQTTTCLIAVDTNFTTTGCRTGPPNSANGNAGVVQGPLQGAGSCTWVLRAESESWWGAGAWYDANIYMDQRGRKDIVAATYSERRIVNQGTQPPFVAYDSALLPPDATRIRWSYTVTILDNTGATHVLTDTNPAGPVGSAIIDANGRLTIALTNWQ